MTLKQSLIALGLGALVILGIVFLGHRTSTDTPVGVKVSTDRQALLNGFEVDAAASTSTVATDLTIGRLLGVTGQVTFDGGRLDSSTFATTSQGTVTYTAASITGISTILHTTAAATTGTLPASTTLSSLVPNTGDQRDIMVTNVGTFTLTMAGGTGTTLTSASSTKAIPPGGSSILRFIRKADTDVAVFMTGGSF